MGLQRHIQRHQLPSYLKVFNRITDKPMGYIGNVSEDGLLLISQLPMLVGARFELRLKVPGLGGRPQCVDFSADCRWTCEDVTPGHFDSGFHLLAPPAEFLELVEALRRLPPTPRRHELLREALGRVSGPARLRAFEALAGQGLVGGWTQDLRATAPSGGPDHR